MVTIELQSADGVQTAVAQDIPLRHVSLDDRSDPCNANLIIQAGAGDDKPVRHVVLEPIHVRLKNGADPHRYSHIQILAENATTTINLRPGVNEALLKGMEI
jgi:hypothetical protein